MGSNLLFISFNMMHRQIFAIFLIVATVIGCDYRSHNYPSSNYNSPQYLLGKNIKKIVNENENKYEINNNGDWEGTEIDTSMEWRYIPRNPKSVVYSENIKFHVREIVNVSDGRIVWAITEFYFDNFEDPPNVFREKAKLINREMGGTPRDECFIGLSELPNGDCGSLFWETNRYTVSLGYHRNIDAGIYYERDRSFMNKYFGMDRSTEWWPINVRRPDYFDMSARYNYIDLDK